MAREERVLAIEGNRPDGSLDCIVVDLDTTISQEDAEAVPVFCEIGKRFAERRLASNAGAMMGEPARKSAINGADRSCRPARRAFGSRLRTSDLARVS